MQSEAEYRDFGKCLEFPRWLSSWNLGSRVCMTETICLSAQDQSNGRQPCRSSIQPFSALPSGGFCRKGSDDKQFTRQKAAAAAVRGILFKGNPFFYTLFMSPITSKVFIVLTPSRHMVAMHGRPRLWYGGLGNVIDTGRTPYAGSFRPRSVIGRRYSANVTQITSGSNERLAIIEVWAKIAVFWFLET